jgi:hypothetical protein
MKAVGETLEGVLHGFTHPLGNAGRLAAFARSQWTDVVRGHTFPGLRADLAPEGRALARLTRQLARAVVRLLVTHRERILELELVHARIAGAVVDLYAMAAVISKLQATGAGASDQTAAGDGGRDQAGDLIIGRSFCQTAATRIRDRLRAVCANEDARILRAGDAVLAGAAIV